MQARLEPTIGYEGMAVRTLQLLMRFNQDNALEEEDQKRNLNLAFESYANPRRLRDKYQKHMRLADDRWNHGAVIARARARMAELERVGQWQPNNPEDIRGFDRATTLERKVQAGQEGILVNCTVEWSTGSVWDPLLMISVFSR